MNIASPPRQYRAELATSSSDLDQIQRLRYDVFVAEFGADSAGVDHASCREADRFDSLADQLILRDKSMPKDADIIGVYRLVRSSQADALDGFYSSTEYDLSRLLTSGGRLLEMSRSCIHPDHRGGTALLHLWKGLTTYVIEHDIDTVFGVASFPGSDPSVFDASLALLHQNHLAPANLRPKAIGKASLPGSAFATMPFNSREAMIAMPALIKAYLRMGGVVGDGAYVDKAFGTTDVCMILETNKLTAMQRAYLGAPIDG